MKMIQYKLNSESLTTRKEKKIHIELEPHPAPYESFLINPDLIIWVCIFRNLYSEKIQIVQVSISWHEFSRFLVSKPEVHTFLQETNGALTTVSAQNTSCSG